MPASSGRISRDGRAREWASDTEALARGRVSPDTRRVLAAQLENPEIVRATADDRGPRNTDVEKLTALVLGSPEFQRK